MLAGAVALAACGSSTTATTPGGAATSSGAASASSDPTVPSSGPGTTTPTASSPSRAATTSLTGTVRRAEVEGSCLLLEDAGSSYLLLGAVTGLAPGQEVTVTGHVDPGRASTCQTGTPFVVERVSR